MKKGYVNDTETCVIKVAKVKDKTEKLSRFPFKLNSMKHIHCDIALMPTIEQMMVLDRLGKLSYKYFISAMRICDLKADKYRPKLSTGRIGFINKKMVPTPMWLCSEMHHHANKDSEYADMWSSSYSLLNTKICIAEARRIGHMIHCDKAVQALVDSDKRKLEAHQQQYIRHYSELYYDSTDEFYMVPVVYNETVVHKAKGRPGGKHPKGRGVALFVQGDGVKLYVPKMKEGIQVRDGYKYVNDVSLYSDDESVAYITYSRTGGYHFVICDIEDELPVHEIDKEYVQSRKAYLDKLHAEQKEDDDDDVSYLVSRPHSPECVHIVGDRIVQLKIDLHKIDRRYADKIYEDMDRARKKAKNKKSGVSYARRAKKKKKK